jgi:YD repeat-containing protein
MKRRLVVAIVALLLPRMVSAQQMSADDLLKSGGLYHDRNYFSTESWEHFDIASGNLLLTFTDLELPGNAGRALRFQRVYNNNGPQSTRGTWSFGIAGMAMFITDTTLPPHSGIIFNDNIQAILATTPVLTMADGAEKRTVYLQSPVADGTMNNSVQYVRTADFMMYDRAGHSLLMADGTVARYEVYDSLAPGYTRYALKEFNDPFGNLVTLTRAPGSLTVRQYLGAGQSRTITYTIDGNGRTTAMSFLDRTWRYDWIEFGPGNAQIQYVHPPADSPAWVFTYDPNFTWMTQITLPTGGSIVYTHEPRQIFDSRYPGDVDHAETLLGVFTRRSAFDRGGTLQGVWELEVGPVQVDPPPSSAGSVTTPSGVRVEYRSDSPGDWAGAGPTLTSNTVTLTDAVSNARIESTVTLMQVLASTSFDGYSWGRPEATQRTITRWDGGQARDYTTTYTYRTSNFADYHHPSMITETGDAGSRSTYVEYQHNTVNSILALPTLRRVSNGSEVFETSWSYDTLGFRRTQVENGISSTFAPDANGNLGTQTNGNNHTTSFGYSWGQIAQMTTPEYTTSRVINQDGTVATETQGGRTATHSYDELGRLRVTQPSGGTNPIIVDYNDAAGVMTTHRGASSVTTTMNGFGLPVRTENSAGVKTHIKYDAEGRKIYESYPFTGTFDGAGDIGTTYQYDGLGRVTRRVNPGSPATQAVYQYGPGTVTITDENGHATTQTRQAFGNPDDTRLASVTDGNSNTWNYTYNALGKLTTVNAPDGITRTWVYNTDNQLATETQPESGNVTYGPYDGAGNLQHKIDANGTTFDYTYDGNERLKTITATPQGGASRVTQITYEPGTDNRQSATVDPVATTFSYDGAGRLNARIDTIDGRQYTQLFQYDNNDNPNLVTYSSGRQVEYQYDGENRIFSVTDRTANRPVASSFSYHPSGAVTSFVSGNGIVNTFTYDASRYWIRSITAGSLLSLNYDNYDGVGNVGMISDSRQSMNQYFGYDALDRLASAYGPWGGVGYQYDAHGNRLTFYGSTYDYYPGTNRLRQQNNLFFTYDSNGNLKTSNLDSFAYTPDNQLETSNVQSTVVGYVYDADGWREKRFTADSATYFLRGARGELLTEAKDPGTPAASARDYIYAGTRLLSVVTAATSPGTACGFTVSPPSIDVDASARSGSITVSTSSRCSWAATSPVPWITITSGQSNTGSGTVTYNIDANPGSTPRNTVLTIATHAVPVTQASASLGDRLQAGQRLLPGQVLTSLLGKFHLKMWDSGVLTVYAYTEDQQRWINGVTAPSGYAEMQSDGNFVVHNSAGAPAWSTGTSGHEGTNPFLIVQDDGNVVIYASDHTTVIWPGIGACVYTPSPPLFTLAHGGGPVNIAVTAPQGCPWSVTPNGSMPNWLTITANQSGLSNGTVSFSVTPDTVAADRQADFTVGNQFLGSHTFTIFQGGTGSLGTDRLVSGARLFPTQSLTSTGTWHFTLTLFESGSLSLSGPTQERWRTDAGAPYADMLPTGNFILRDAVSNNIILQSNTDGHPGAYAVVQSDGNFVVYDSNNTYLWSHPVGACTYALSSPSVTYGPGATTGSVSVIAPAGCPWTATATDPWVGITSGASGEGSGLVGYSVASNSGAFHGTTITIANPVANRSFTITQGGQGSLGTDRLLAGQRMYTTNFLTSVNGGSGSFTFKLFDSGALSLSGPTQERWRSDPGGQYAEMQTDGNFVLRNPGGGIVYQTGSGGHEGTNPYLIVQSDGNVVIYTASHVPIFNLGMACTYGIAPLSAAYDHNASSGSVTVTAPVGCPWSASSPQTWVGIGSGLSGEGNGTVNYSVAANPSVATRGLPLTIANLPFVISQGGAPGNVGDHLDPGQRLYDGQWLTSSDGRFTLSLSSNSSLSLSKNGSPKWSDGHTPGVGYVEMLADGNFRKFDLLGHVTLDYRVALPGGSAAQGPPTPNSHLVVQSDGNVVIYRPDTSWSWQTVTGEPQCTFAVTPNPLNVDYSYSTGWSFNVTTQPSCTWSASSTGWVTITDGWSGTGSGTVTVDIAGNVQREPRSMQLTIAEQPVTVYQNGAPPNRLLPGERLWPNQSISSPSGQYTLVYQSDTNLVLYGPGGPVWSTLFCGCGITYPNNGAPGFAIMQAAGNFVVYDSAISPAWANSGAGIPGSFVTVEESGHIVIWTPDGMTALYVF